jgi:hypothetical protein
LLHAASNGCSCKCSVDPSSAPAYCYYGLGLTKPPGAGLLAQARGRMVFITRRPARQVLLLGLSAGSSDYSPGIPNGCLPGAAQVGFKKNALLVRLAPRLLLRQPSRPGAAHILLVGPTTGCIKTKFYLSARARAI